MEKNPELRVALKLSRAIHKISNCTVVLKDGTVVPGHHAGFDTEARMYSIGQSKKETLHTNVVLPAFDRAGNPYNIYKKIEKGDTVVARSRYTPSLSERLRVASLVRDEASVTFAATFLN